MASRLDFSQIRSLYIGTSSGTTVDTNNLIVSGNVGIGTTSPSTTLDVGDGQISGVDVLYGDSSGSLLLAGYDKSSLASSFIGFYTADGTASGERMRITSTGNVGIGTTSPSARLHIGESGAPAQLWLQRTDGYNPVKLIGGTLADGNGFKITMNTTDAFAITSGGNVGIGTTSPSYKLDVSGDINFSNTLKFAGVNVIHNSSTDVYINGRVLYSNSTLNDGMYINYNSTSGAGAHLRFFANGTSERMRIDASTGYVGIGTTSPGYILDTASAARFNGVRAGRDFSIAGRATVRIDANGDYPADVLFGQTPAATQSGWDGVYWSISSRNSGAGSSEGNKFTIWRGNAHAAPNNSESQFITITPDLNMGIGNTTPSFKLDVNGAIRTQTGYIQGANSAADITIDGITGTLTRYGDQKILLNSADAIIYTANSVRLYINNAGNIGTSTTSPVAGLDLQNSNGTFRQKNFTTMVTENLAANGTQARRFEIARMSIDYNDWNSIGTLEVELHERYYSQGLKKRYSIYYGYVSYSGCNLVEMSGHGDNQFQVTIGPEVVISGDIRYIPVYVEVRYYSQVTAVLRTTRYLTTANPPGQSNIWVNSNPTPVDISDFTPDSTVYAGNIIGGNTTFPTGNIGIGTTSPAFTSGDGLEIQRSSTTATLRLDTGVFATELRAYTDGTFLGQLSNSYLDLGTNNSTKVRITGDGNVGIGTTSPGAKLEVKLSGDGEASSVFPTGTWAAKVFNTQDTSTYGGLVVGSRYNSNDNIIFQAGSLYAAWRPYFTVKGAGYVGIGTTSPSSLLHVSGTTTAITITDTTYNRTSSIGYLDSANLYFANDPSSNTLIGAYNGVFLAYGGGNVGIGTTSPAKKLHVYNAGPNQGLRASNLDGVNMDVLSGANGGIVGTYSNHPLSLYTNSTEKVTITAAGNVGIGNTLPNYPLHVKGGSVKFESQSNLTGFFKANTTQCNISFEDTTNASNDIVYIGSIGNNFMIATNYDERVRVNSSGNLGVATTNPTAKLHVNGTVRMDNQGAAVSNQYGPGGGNTVGDVIGNNSDNRVLGSPDVWLRINVDGTNYVFPGYTEP